MRRVTRVALALLVFALPAARAASEGAGAWPIEVASGVYMLRGATGEADAGNRGRIGNAGFIVGERGVVAIDSGTSWREGRALLEAIARVTERPVRMLVLTHARQEFIFGAAAWRERGIPIAMQRQAAGLMRSRCAGCLSTLRGLLGEAEMQGTALIEPDLLFDDALELDALVGRAVRVLSFGHSSGPGDAVVLDVRSGTLFGGGLLDVHRIPDVQDADLAAWKRALRELHALRATTLVPGHGPAAPARFIYAVERYLTQLEVRVRELLRANAALSIVPGAVQLPEFSRWDQYDTIHRRNASIVFLRLEREDFAR
jgi:glyoxylase-like metal-dependent hydrolase (beta-lactamase superfamily II)